jgi:ubiquitin-conjugating enzyme E2 Z
MDGKFQYPSLRKRLLRIKEALDAETIGWVEQGLNAVEAESRVAVNLQHQFEQLQALFKQREVPHSIALEGGNPFVWTLTYIGGPMTNLDGGLFRIKIYFSPRFPDEQPRARFESKLFHHHIAPDGTACYTPDLKRREDVQSHIQAIIAILEDEEPAYDPRTIVNPEASKLFWGKVAGDRKMYSRMLRRSVQESMENFPE